MAERLLRQAEGLEISVLDTDADARPASARSRHPVPLGDYGLALGAALIASALAWGAYQVLALPNISLVFLAAVLLVAVRSSLGPALLCAGVSFLAYDFLFIPPNFSLTIARQEDVLTLLFFLLMAGLTGNLASRQRRQLQALRATQTETTALLDLSRKLTAATDRQAVLSVAAQQFIPWTDVEVCLLARSRDGVWKVEAGVQRLLADQERAAAEWSWQHDQVAGLGTGTLPSGRWWWLPLSGEEGPLALLGVSPRDGAPLPAERRRLLSALGQPLAQALARAQLAEDLEAARLHGETEQLRSALLASVSRPAHAADRHARFHRQPAGARRGDPLEDRRELLEGTRDEAERLDRYIQNLLDMTRLGHGGLKLARDWVAPVDIVASALQRLRPVLAPLKVETVLPAELPLLYVHAALIEQALVNVLENAARFSPSQGRLRVAVTADDEELRFAVSDQGPGIPAAEREKIFDMFYTAARGDRGGQGTGLGLAICQGMVGAHGGRVTVGEGWTARAPRSPCTCRCIRSRCWRRRRVMARCKGESIRHAGRRTAACDPARRCRPGRMNSPQHDAVANGFRRTR